MLSLTASVLYITQRKHGTRQQLLRAVVPMSISTLLLGAAQLWYIFRFSPAETSIASLETGLALLYIALWGWFVPLSVTIASCLSLRSHVSQTTARPAGQGPHTPLPSVEAAGAAYHPPRKQPGVSSAFVYSADRSWGWLVYRNGKFVGQELALKRSIASIGREEDNEVWLDDDTISRYHAELAWDKGQVYITDNGSLNGVLLNGQRIRTSMLVKEGDELEIGDHRFAIKYASPQDALDDLDDDILLPQLRRSRSNPGTPIGNSNPGGSGMRNSNPGTPIGNSNPGGSGVRNSNPGISRAGSSNPGGRHSYGPTAALPPSQQPITQGGLEHSPFASRPGGQEAAGPVQQTPLPAGRGAEGVCIILTGETPGRSFLLDRPVLTLGSDAPSDIIIRDPAISRCHLRFLHQTDGDYVQNLASTHESLVNSAPLQAVRRLSRGDLITLGNIRLEYTLLPEAQTSLIPLPPPPTPFSFPLPMRLPSKSREDL